MSTNTLSITVGEYLFEFASYIQWVNKAPSWFGNLGSYQRRQDVICIDTKGRICRTGKQFMRADREGAFPIKVFQATVDETKGGET